MKFLNIGINHSYAGFFAYVNFAVNQILYAERHGLQPVVNFSNWSGDGPNAFYDPARGTNMWDYYFEPVADLTYAELVARVADPDELLSNKDILKLSSKELWFVHSKESQNVYPYPHGIHYQTY
ncbi:MAG: hypothetical protein ACI8P9_000828 [Parasphingorhabdus sp.]|jgi:hypothetical protein